MTRSGGRKERRSRAWDPPAWTRSPAASHGSHLLHGIPAKVFIFQFLDWLFLWLYPFTPFSWGWGWNAGSCVLGRPSIAEPHLRPPTSEHWTSALHLRPPTSGLWTRALPWSHCANLSSIQSFPVLVEQVLHPPPAFFPALSIFYRWTNRDPWK